MTKQRIRGGSGLALGALGVVFGDIGTSPLYALPAIFGGGQHLPITQANIYGIISLILWSITLIVSIKYIGFIMRADNKGEGGIIALVAKIRGSTMRDRYKLGFLLLGIVGVALFYGDSTITPAISVLSAVEGLRIVAPDLTALIIPITLAILAILFAIQRFGTGVIGGLFGPIMFVWFGMLAIGGLGEIWKHPDILVTLSPLTALEFITTQPVIAFLAMGVIILAITGAEALYADMGHFGRKPIAQSWFFIVFPALALCYMGEGSLILNNPEAIVSPLLLLFPEPYRIPFLILAALATVIASQSVISGAFSLTRQAVQLNLLPKMIIRHTSLREGGQIYIPLVNALLFVVVSFLVVAFGSSTHMSSAYGVAVSGALAIDTVLYLAVMKSLWRTHTSRLLLVALAFVPIDIIFITSNIPKVISGGWFPILVGIIIFTVIDTWRRGQVIVSKERKILEGPLQAFVEKVHTKKPPVLRIPGTAVYIGHHAHMTPLALHATFDDLHELHEKVVVVFVEVTSESHIPEKERADFDNLIYNDGISYVRLSFGFHDSLNIPETLRTIRGLSPELDFDPNEASFFVSLGKIVQTKRHTLSHWRKYIYQAMDRNSLSPSDFYRLPIEHTVEMRSLIKL